ncbi:putative signal-transduction protein containing cAMP-binding and CBS domains [Beggiatoa alba B18LD]|uniref:Putative signal-transduction protein containing cAMP-binding and CBS domains n=1 Tax=Beggiatoa alba B18LD TaxID=395493 RepID=I3CF01_9GAMM|nr:CBS domain-containing protein [Beggiatoa alba]EIJ42194.1 putative signal-transduction protein containing cAMP-binding and CBS domains [Beggiatoa alba B18LD]
MTLKRILDQKGMCEVVSIVETATMLAATKKMCEHYVGAVLIVSNAGLPIGIVTERDVLRFCATRSTELDTVLVTDVMTKDLIIGTFDTPIDEALTIMTEKKFRHIPIVDSGKIVGMVSLGDLVKIKLKETSVEAKHLRDYIAMA